MLWALSTHQTLTRPGKTSLRCNVILRDLPGLVEFVFLACRTASWQSWQLPRPAAQLAGVLGRCRAGVGQLQPICPGLLALQCVFLCCSLLCLALMQKQQSIHVCTVHMIQCIGNDTYRHVQSCRHSCAAYNVAIDLEASFITLSKVSRTRVVSLQYYASSSYSCKP